MLTESVLAFVSCQTWLAVSGWSRRVRVRCPYRVTRGNWTTRASGRRNTPLPHRSALLRCTSATLYFSVKGGHTLLSGTQCPSPLKAVTFREKQVRFSFFTECRGSRLSTRNIPNIARRVGLVCGCLYCSVVTRVTGFSVPRLRKAPARCVYLTDRCSSM